MKPSSESHEARKSLFQLGIRRGHLSLDEIDRALPPGSLSPSERWLLFYSLRAAGVEIRDRAGASVEVPREPPGGDEHTGDEHAEHAPEPGDHAPEP